MNIFRNSCTALLGALVLAAHAAPAPSPELAAVDLTSADLEFMLQATRTDIAELKAARMALQRSHDPEVRAFAEQLVQDHTAAQKQLAQIARDKGVALPKLPSHAQQAMLDGLAGVGDRAFDAQFLDRAGVHDHREAIARYHAELARPHADPALAAFAAATLPVLTQHLQAAEAAQARWSQSGAHASDAAADLRDAVQVVHTMKEDPQMARLLHEASGVLVLPDYGRAALGVGVQAGEGVLVTRHGQAFSDPAFFDLAGISLGLQAGAAGGPVALLLMTDRAVQQFRSNRTLSLNAAAGLTIGAYSARHQASSGKLEDVIVWSGTRGLYAGGALGINEVTPDAEANRAYYGRPASPNEILGGLVPNPHNNVLGTVLAI